MESSAAETLRQVEERWKVRNGIKEIDEWNPAYRDSDNDIEATISFMRNSVLKLPFVP